MSIVTLQADRNLALTYNAPMFGSTLVEVEAEFPITVLALDAPNLAAWRSGLAYLYLAQFVGVQQVSHQMYLPSRLQWFLVLANYGRVNSAVWHRVKG